MDKSRERPGVYGHAYVAPASEPGARATRAAGNASINVPQGASRRYTGRASTARHPADSLPPAPVPRQRAQPLKNSLALIARIQTVRWSLRLAVAVALIGGVALGLRLPGIFTAPVDAPVGVQATHALFARVMAGQVTGTLDPVRLLPPPAPWYGPAPVNPASSLPLYDWLASLGMRLLGDAWVGRLLSLFFSLLAGMALFALVRRVAGARAGLYSLLLFAGAPLSVIVGRAFSPDSLALFTQAVAVLSLVAWRSTTSQASAQGSGLVFWSALLCAAFAGLLDPGSIFLVLPALYIIVAPRSAPQEGGRWAPEFARTPRSAAIDWRDAWEQSKNRGKAFGYIGAVVGAVALWWLFGLSGGVGLSVGVGDGGGGVIAIIAALLNGGTYVQLVGQVVEKVLTIVGLLLVLAGLLQGARQPLQLLFHAWLVAGLAQTLVEASRLGRHDDVLLPLLLPLCALVGIGASWAGSLPARVWLAVSENRHEADADYAVSPPTSWLLDLPEERIAERQPKRPQAQLALGKSVAQRAARAGAHARRASLMVVGHLLVLGCFGLIFLSGWHATYAALQPSEDSLQMQAIGREIASETPPGARLVVAGPHAPELFYASARTGWALGADSFSIAAVQELKAQGASYLLSTDQAWLGQQPDYVGLLTDYSVLKLTNNYILFDLNTRPSASDRLYFLESGHTLGGKFKTFWEQHGGVQKLGYPISEEMDVVNPIDGQTRKVQYFERAVLELHTEFAGTPNEVQLASVGLWVTKGRNFPRVAQFESSADNAYFPQTGHSVKQAFLKYWQAQGGVAAFGYPISEELPEIGADGKVYTVQYFERARLEWHPTAAGTADEVQLGLIGKQALEMEGGGQ